MLATCSVLHQNGKLKPAVFPHASISKTFNLVPYLPQSWQMVHQNQGVLLTSAAHIYKYFQDKCLTLVLLYVILNNLPETGSRQ